LCRTNINISSKELKIDNRGIAKGEIRKTEKNGKKRIPISRARKN